MKNSHDICVLDVDDAMKLHDTIFGYHDVFSKPENWKKYEIIIGTEQGFVAGYHKNGKPHLSLAGVVESARGSGLFGCMVREFAAKMGNEFTISTYPEKYLVMASWIMRHGVDVIKEEDKLTATIRM